MTLNLANLFEAVAAAVPERVAVTSGDRRLTYAELDARANRFANHLVSSGVGPGEHVGIYMLNSVEYVEALLGCFKARAVPININYRYTEHELLHLFDNADLVAVVADTDFVPHVAALVSQCPRLRHLLVVGETETVSPQGLTTDRFEEALAGQPDQAPRVDERSPDDTYVLYTGGTTGLPKGIVWRHEDFYFAALTGGNPYGDPHRTADDLAAAAANGGVLTYLLTMPLMHGAATYTLFTGLLGGAHMVLMRRYDPVEALRLIEAEKAQILAVVGDAIVRPFVDALREHRGEQDLSSLFVVGSGGAILSKAVEQELLAEIPQVMVRNSFGASESGVDGQIAVGEDGRMRLQPSPTVRVVDADLNDVVPGSGDVGFVARSGHVPVAYYNDPERSARTFPVIDGVRWSVLGDVAEVEADGSIVVHGRGSGCINTGGEKVRSPSGKADYRWAKRALTP